LPLVQSSSVFSLTFRELTHFFTLFTPEGSALSRFWTHPPPPSFLEPECPAFLANEFGAAHWPLTDCCFSFSAYPLCVEQQLSNYHMVKPTRRVFFCINLFYPHLPRWDVVWFSSPNVLGSFLASLLSILTHHPPFFPPVPSLLSSPTPAPLSTERVPYPNEPSRDNPPVILL